MLTFLIFDQNLKTKKIKKEKKLQMKYIILPSDYISLEESYVKIGAIILLPEKIVYSKEKTSLQSQYHFLRSFSSP